MSPGPVYAPGLRMAAAAAAESLLRIACSSACSLAISPPICLLSGRELGCELVNTLAYRCETERKLFQIG